MIALPIRLLLVAVTFAPHPGNEYLESIPNSKDDVVRKDVWLWTHWVTDPAGASAQHFSLIDQVWG